MNLARLIRRGDSPPATAGAWSWSAPSLLAPSYGPVAEAIVAGLAPGALVVAALHVWLSCCPLPGLGGRTAEPTMEPNVETVERMAR
jgi:hypothetical protein